MRRAWFFVFLLSIGGALNYLDRMMITTMRYSIMEAIPMTDTQFGLLTSSFLWVYGAFSPLGGYLADRFERSRVIIASIVMWSLVTFITAYATSFETLLFTRILMGISEACYIPAALALIADYHGPRTRSLAVGVHMAGIITGQSMGFLGGWMAESHVWNYPFLIFGGGGIVYGTFLALVLRDNKADGDHHLLSADGSKGLFRFHAAITGLFRNRQFVIASCFWGILGIVGWLIMGWLPTYYKERFSLSQTQAGIYATGYLYPLSLVGVLFGGALADRWSKTSRRARIFLPAFGLIIAAPGILLAAGADSVSIAVGGFMVYAFFRAFTDANMMPILCLVVEPRFRATGYGVLNLFGCIIGGIGLYAGGVMRDEAIPFAHIFYASAVGTMVCALLLLLIKPRFSDD